MFNLSKKSENSVCDDCSNKKICKDCNLLKTDFYTYQNGKLYSTCKECFNKKVVCEYCNRKYNKTYLSKHKKRCPSVQQSCPRVPEALRATGTEDTEGASQAELLRCALREEPPVFAGGDSPKAAYNNKNDNNDNNNDNDILLNKRTLIVGPSFCGKTYLLLNKLKLIRLCDSEKQIKILTRSTNQYSDPQNFEIEDLEIEKDVGDMEDYQNCCVVFDGMLDSNQKLIEPFFSRGRHNDLDVYYLSQSYFKVDRTIRINSNIIILFQQTIEDVKHIYRDVAGFDMSYEEFKSLCREAWKEKYNYLEINMFEDKKGKKYKICNESNMKCKIFNPETAPF